MTLFEGTQTDTQADISSPDEYGCGQLATSESAGSSEFDVTIEDTAQTIFRTGDMIWIGDGTHEEYHDNVTISKTGTTVTITLDTGDQLAYAYTAGATCYVASVYEPGDVEGSVTGWTETSAAGTYNESTYPVVVDNIGGVEDTFTVTFSSATNFSCSGAIEGSVGTGNISTDFTPSNADFTKPYFTLSASGWGGTWASGDTVAFTTHPASSPVWLKQLVPAGTPSAAANSFIIGFTGESA